MWSYHHKSFTVHQLPALKDNYIYLIESHSSQILAAVDPADASVVKNGCRKLGKPLTHILNTHHHWDHTDGNAMLKSTFSCTVIGSAVDADRIPGIDIMVDETETQLLDLPVSVLFVPGHTRGHIAFLIEDALFCGDTLFGAGCGRLFEGTSDQMWHSLLKLSSLPDATKVYCAHEYTLSNLRFAVQVDPDNRDLIDRLERDTDRQVAALPTIPSELGIEKSTNPFLRPADPSFCTLYSELNGTENSALAVFTDIRSRKDHF